MEHDTLAGAELCQAQVKLRLVVAISIKWKLTVFIRFWLRLKGTWLNKKLSRVSGAAVYSVSAAAYIVGAAACIVDVQAYTAGPAAYATGAAT